MGVHLSKRRGLLMGLWDPTAFEAEALALVSAMERAVDEAEDDVVDEAKALVGSDTQLAQTIAKAPDGSIEVGADYAWYVEHGSPAVEGKLMAFQVGGQTVFTRKRRAIPAHPFFEPAVERFDDFLTKRMERLS